MNPELQPARDASPSRGTSTALRRLLAVIVSLAVLAVAGVGLAEGASAKPAPGGTLVTSPVTGTAPDGSTVAGTLDVTKFVARNGTLQAVGTFAGTITDTAGNVVASGTQQITLPVLLPPTAASCEILDLVLGPLDLNLLGLEVHLDTVHLNITAVPGPGNLLGNLLCAIAGLLDGPSPLSGIAALLNRVLAILG